jgi:hypothetical protein
MNRGRPKKSPEDQLIEKLNLRMTPRDKRLLKQVADHKSIAPETLIRSIAIPSLRKLHSEIFGAI